MINSITRLIKFVPFRPIATLFAALIVGINICTPAYADKAARAEISDILKECFHASAKLTPATASNIALKCNAAISNLQNFADTRVLDSIDQNWYRYNRGAALLLLSGAQIIELDNRLSRPVCNNILDAKGLWDQVDAKSGTKLEKHINNDPILKAFYPQCKKIMGAK